MSNLCYHDFNKVKSMKDNIQGMLLIADFWAQWNATIRIKCQIMDSRPNEMQMISWEYGLIPPANICMKIQVKRHHKTSSPGIRNESENYRIDFGQSSSFSVCSPAGHHYASPLWSSLKDLHISQAFFNHHVLLTAVAPLLEPCQ